MTITAVIRRMNQGNAGLRWFNPHAGNAQVVPHGFRSTFRDWAAEKTEFPNEMVEMALAHAVGDKVEAAYRRGNLLEKRHKLMEEWGLFCTTKLHQ
jgi:integrase